MQKIKLIKLVKNYIAGEIDAEKFCYDYEEIFYHEDEDGSISKENEILLLSLYDSTIKRYSHYENDIKLYKFYIGQDDVKKSVVEFYSINKDKLL